MDTDDVRQALRNKFKSPEWINMEEVGNGTGANCKRHADMLLFNMYPSRSLAIVGIEIKVSRSDLKHELDTPQKAEEIAQYCNEWYLPVPKGLIRDDDIIPVNWGILEIEKSGTVRKKKAAKWFDDKPIPKSFWAALIRKADETLDKKKDEIYFSGYKSAEERFKKEIQEARSLITANKIRKEKANVLSAMDKYFGWQMWSMHDEDVKLIADSYNNVALYNDLKRVTDDIKYSLDAAVKRYNDDMKELNDALKVHNTI